MEFQLKSILKPELAAWVHSSAHCQAYPHFRNALVSVGVGSTPSIGIRAMGSQHPFVTYADRMKFLTRWQLRLSRSGDEFSPRPPAPLPRHLCCERLRRGRA